MLELLSATLMLVDLFVAVMKVTVSVAIMQLEVSATHMPVKISASSMWVTIFTETMQVRESQVVFSTVDYAHDYFHCNYERWLFLAMYVTASSSKFIFFSLTSIFQKIDPKNERHYIKFAFYHFNKYSSKIKIRCGENLYTNRLKGSFSTFVFLIGL